MFLCYLFISAQGDAPAVVCNRNVASTTHYPVEVAPLAVEMILHAILIRDLGALYFPTRIHATKELVAVQLLYRGA